jgi:hypothetical protein
MTGTIRDELEQIRSKGLYRSTRLIQGRQSTHVMLDGREVLMLPH